MTTTIATLWKLHGTMTGGLELVREAYLGLDNLQDQDQVDAANALLTDLDDLEALAESILSDAWATWDAADGPQQAQDRRDAAQVQRDATAALNEAQRTRQGVLEHHNI